MFRHAPRGSRRSRRTAVVAAAAVVLVGAACAGDDSADGSSRIRVGLVCGGMTPMTAQVAINADTFPDEVEVEKFCFDSGSEAVQALVGGSLDVFMGSVEHVLSTREQGLPVKAYAGINNRAPYSLVTSADSDVDSVSDLEGENVGVTSPGSLSDTELHWAAQEEGAAYDSMKVLGAGSGSTMAAAISQEQIAAGMVSEPQQSQLLRTGDYRLVWEPTTPYAAIVVVANSEWVSDNAATMEGFLNGLAEAADKTQTDQSFATSAMQKEDFPVDEQVLEAAVQAGTKTIPNDLVVSEKVYQDTADVLVGVGVLEESAVVPYDEAFDFSLLPEQS